MSDYQDIIVQTEERVTTITLNRPDRLNAWTARMGEELRTAVVCAGNDPATRCIIITGAGRGFCAGADMELLEDTANKGASRPRGNASPEFAFTIDEPGLDLSAAYPGQFGYLYACPKPVIAAINGPCAGIGLVLALYADLRFADQTAKFTTAFAARGLIAEHGIAWLLPRLIGEANALDLLLTARKFTGTEAAAMGLVNKALPGDALMEHVQATARVLANEVSPRSLAIIKRQVRAALSQSFRKSLAIAARQMEQSFTTFDFKEGVRSFIERRPPAFEDLS